MAITEDISTSGFVKSLSFSMSDVFSGHEEIGSRGSCRLYRAQRYGKWYVLKGLKPEYAGDQLRLAMLEKEFATAVRMVHPNIVQTFSHEHDEVAGECIVMEYIDGRTLADFLKEKPSFKARKRVAGQILAAMAYYHSLQIVHRDLKPSNIMVTRNGDNVKLIDFGLADTDDYAQLKEPAYTVGYAAPEQMRTGETIDCRTDIYAFGVLLREMFPKRYKRVAGRCCQPNPKLRYPNAAEVEQALRKVDRRRKWRWTLLPLLLLLFLLPVVVKLFLIRSHDTVPLQPPQEEVEPVKEEAKAEPEAVAEAAPARQKEEKAVGGYDAEVDAAVAKMRQYCRQQQSSLKERVEMGTVSCQEELEATAVKASLETYLYEMQLIDAMSDEVKKDWRSFWYDLNDLAIGNEAALKEYAASQNLRQLSREEMETWVNGDGKKLYDECTRLGQEFGKLHSKLSRLADGAR